MKGALLSACLVCLLSYSEQQRPSETSFGTVMSKARFGQGRPFSHFGRRRPHVPPASPIRAASTVEPSGGQAASPLSPPQAERHGSRDSTASPRVTASGGQRQDLVGAGAQHTSPPRTVAPNQPLAVGRNDALRGVQAGSFVVLGGENNANRPTEVITSNKINIESRLSSATATSVHSESVRVGGTAILHCNFEERDRPAANQPAQIWWTKLPNRSTDKATVLASGSLIRFPDERLKVVAFPESLFSVLIIRGSVEEDGAEYKCSLPTVTGYKTAFTRLEVKESLESQIDSSEPSNVVMAGDNYMLFCKSKTGQPLSVWWSAKSTDGRTINVAGADDKTYGETLSLLSVSKDMEGVYTCHIENKEGAPLRKHFSLTLKERPWEVAAYQQGLKAEALLWQTSRPVAQGEAVDLRCDSGGIPRPSIKWLKNGRLLPESSPRHAITSYHQTYKQNAVVSKLTISAFSYGDGGRYTCAVENEVGYREYTFDVKEQQLDANEV